MAVLAYVNVLLLSNPRVMYAMSTDGILPKAFQKKDEKRDVLTVSLTVFAAICVIVLFFADKFENLHCYKSHKSDHKRQCHHYTVSLRIVAGLKLTP